MKIQGSVSQHDKYQIEMKFSCPVDRNKKVNDYHIDVFFFLPRNLAVNPQTYTRELFYNDLSEYIRLTTPKVEIANLAKPDNVPLVRLAEALYTSDYTEQLKMFCSILRVAFRDGCIQLQSFSVAELPEQVSSFIRHSNAALTAFRALRPRLANGPEQKLELFDLVDEFLSLALTRRLYAVWKMMEHRKLNADTAQFAEIHRCITDEINHRKELKCPSIPVEDDDNSELLYRESTLKKAMGSVLYLNTSMRKDGVLIENILLSAAAALAMIFVTGISFLWKGLFLEEFSISFFIVWVIAYMFKDRIKSLLQGWFSSHKESYSFDYKQKISDDMGRKVGVCHEGMCYRKEDAIDPHLMQLRDRTSLSRLENGSLSENILVFRKRIELFTDACEPLYQAFSINGVTDIVRLNVRDWLRKMDNPVKEICLPTQDGKLETIKAKRIYHVNMVIRYGEEGKPEDFLRYRLILARNGIQSVEWKS